jgi:hypothetical protein
MEIAAAHILPDKHTLDTTPSCIAAANRRTIPKEGT